MKLLLSSAIGGLAALALANAALAASGPTVGADTATVQSNTSVVINVLANDTAATGQVLLPGTIYVTVSPQFGIATADLDSGAVTYTSIGGYVGIDKFTYTICDDQPVCANGVATVTVTAAPSGETTEVATWPAAEDDSASVQAGSSISLDIISNDTTQGSTSLDFATLKLTSQPGHGSATLNAADGAVTYSANAGFSGADTFTYSICDDQAVDPRHCDSATVTITVVALAPTPAPTQAPTATPAPAQPTATTPAPASTLVVSAPSVVPLPPKTGTGSSTSNEGGLPFALVTIGGLVAVAAGLGIRRFATTQNH